MYTHLVPDRRIRATIKPTLGERIRTSTLKASTDNIKINDSIVDRVGGYNFLPTLIAASPRRKQCPLYSVNSESSLLGCAGSEGCMTGWSPRTLRASHHKPIDSTRVETGQPSFRGRVRCQSPFIAGERRRCEPGSNSVIVTAPFTGCEGHVLRLGGVLRTRKIFVGCPAIRPFWDQSPGRTASRFEAVGNRLYPLHDQDCLRRFTAEAQIQDRSRKSTGLNTAPGFLRVKCPFREAKGARKPKRPQTDRGGCPRELPRLSRAGGNPEKNKARHLPPSQSVRGRERSERGMLPRTRGEPREKQSTPTTPLRAAQENDDRAQATEPAKQPSGGCPRIINTQPQLTSSTT